MCVCDILVFTSGPLVFLGMPLRCRSKLQFEMQVVSSSAPRYRCHLTRAPVDTSDANDVLHEAM